MSKVSPIITAADLTQLMKSEQVVLIDARTGPDAGKRYREGHLENALFADLEKDLAKIADNAADGGRHPLPDIRDFSAFIGRLGIGPGAHVVVYDDKNGANAAARFWWMVRALGHEKVQVLSGGLKAALDNGWVLTSDPSVVKEKPSYPATRWQLSTVNADNVANAAKDASKVVIDVREGFRYRGESEPIDTVAGHIPGAINVPYTGNLDSSGYFLSSSELREKYKSILRDKKPGEIIVHCGSGVTACHTLLAMEEAGYEIPHLYVGSWSEWSRNERPVAKGEN